MSKAGRIQAQQVRHREIDQRIQQEEQRLCPDSELIRAMKREKLAIRDHITALEADREPMAAE